jgi:hypothetical protein
LFRRSFSDDVVDVDGHHVGRIKPQPFGRQAEFILVALDPGVIKRALGDLFGFIRRERDRDFPGLLFPRDNRIMMREACWVLGW